MVPSIFSLCVATVCCAASPESGLAALYTFEEGSGTALHDSSGAGHNGRIIGGAWAKTAAATALDLDGIGDYVDCEDEPSTRLKGPLTVAVWVRPFWQRKQSVVLRGDWNLTIEAGGVPTMNARRAGTSKGGAMDTVRAGAPIAANERSHVVGVYDTARKCLEIYVNGALSGSTGKSDGSIGGIFRSKLVLGRRFNGLMADCRLYARSLSAAEIRSLREATAPDPSLRIPSCRLRLRARLFYRTRKIVASLAIRHPKPRGTIAADAVILRAGESKPIQQKHIDSLSAVAQAEVGFSLEGQPSGRYDVVASAKSPDGKTLATLSKPVIVPEKPWWLDTGVGVADEVLPPWTPLEVARSKDSGETRIGCWGRTYEYGAAAFPQQIETSGKAVLAEPIRLV